MPDFSELSYDAEESVFTDNKVDDDSGVLKSYNYEANFEYPYLMLKSTGDIATYQVTVLSNILEKEKVSQKGVPKGYFKVYLTTSDGIFGLGLLPSSSLRVVLSGVIYKDFYKYIMLDSETQIEGDLMYAYATNVLL